MKFLYDLFNVPYIEYVEEDGQWFDFWIYTRNHSSDILMSSYSFDKIAHIYNYDVWNYIDQLKHDYGIKKVFITRSENYRNWR